MINFLLLESKVWAVGKNWIWRVPLLVYFAVLLFGYVTNPSYWSVLDWLNLPIHEMGHIVFGWCGQFIAVLGGSLLQCLAPIGGMVNFYYQRDFFAIALCFGWLSTNFFSVANYIADARTQQLHLVSIGGGEPIHDWHYLLNTMGLLQFDIAIAVLVKLLAVAVMGICFVYGGWLIKYMVVKQ